MQVISVSSAQAASSGWRVWLVDTFAVTLFFTIVGGLNEYFVADLTLEQVVQTRIGAVPILIVTGALYGGWRDMVHRLTRFARQGQTLRVWIDTAACLSFRVPVYGTILLLGGAEGAEFTRGLAGGTVIILLSGRPCGIAIDGLRCLTGLQRRSGT